MVCADYATREGRCPQESIVGGENIRNIWQILARLYLQIFRPPMFYCPLDQADGSA